MPRKPSGGWTHHAAGGLLGVLRDVPEHGVQCGPAPSAHPTACIPSLGGVRKSSVLKLVQDYGALPLTSLGDSRLRTGRGQSSPASPEHTVCTAPEAGGSRGQVGFKPSPPCWGLSWPCQPLPAPLPSSHTEVLGVPPRPAPTSPSQHCLRHTTCPSA